MKSLDNLSNGLSDLMTTLKERSEVHLWSRRFDLERDPLDGEWAVLGQLERERAAKFRFPADRNRFVRRHLYLREVLARYLGGLPGDLPLMTPLNQPPSLTHGPHAADLRFSLSSSADYAAVALTFGRRVGVDVEKARPMSSDLDIAKRFFSFAENEALQSTPMASRTAVFFQIWTRKEAFVKGLGVGLARDLASFDVLGCDRWPPDKTSAIINDRETMEKTPWLVRDKPIAPDVALACASETDDWTLVSMEDVSTD